MPIYEYKCSNKSCGHKMECLQKVSDEPLKLCPACKEESLTKLISAAGFRLKGSGWYETDFKNKPTTNSIKSEGSAVTVDKSSSTNSSSDS